MSRLDEATMTDAQRQRLNAALTLLGYASIVIAMRSCKVDSLNAEAKMELICTAGAIAEAYVITLRYMNFLLRRKFGRVFVSDEDTVSAWRIQYEWLTSGGVR